MIFGKKNSANGRFEPAKLEMVRLAIARSVYTQNHIDYVTECVGNVLKKREAVIGMRIAHEQPVLRHFTAIFEPL